jgi:ferredoxin-thioredoxin reductase catalytic chain
LAASLIVTGFGSKIDRTRLRNRWCQVSEPELWSFYCAGEPSEKSLEVMRKFSEQYARKSDTFFCVDKGVTAVVVKGLAEHKDTLGAPLCPCRHYDDKVAEVQQGFWNCPCVPMRERKECHCMLFLTPENDFAGEDQHISLKEIQELTA